MCVYTHIYSPSRKYAAMWPCNMKNRDIYWRRYKIQETLYTGQWHLSPLQGRHLGTSHSSPDCHQLPHRIFLNLIDSLISLPFQRLSWNSRDTMNFFLEQHVSVQLLYIMWDIYVCVLIFVCVYIYIDR